MLSKGRRTAPSPEAIRALSSFFVVRVVVDRKAVQRPFSVVFQIDEDPIDTTVGGWDRLRAMERPSPDGLR